jgi:F0F1-type ATP synthase membrane subunit c/vacuolar-type H+-ATPase subunit K
LPLQALAAEKRAAMAGFGQNFLMRSSTNLQMLRFTMLTSVVLYAVVGEMAGPKNAPQPLPIMFHVLTFMAIGIVALAFVMRRLLMKPSATDSGAADPAVLNRWRTANILTYVISEAVALFGLVLRMMGFTLSQVVPFYLAGFILILFLAPRLPSNPVA